MIFLISINGKNDDNSIGNVFNKMLSEYKMESKIYEIKIMEFFNKLFSDSVSKHITKVVLKKTVLTIYIDSASLKSDFNYSKETLINQINNYLERKIIDSIELH